MNRSLRHRPVAELIPSDAVARTDHITKEHQPGRSPSSSSVRPPLRWYPDIVYIVLNVLNLIPPFLVTFEWTKAVFTVPPAASLRYLTIVLVALFHLATAILTIVDTSWRLPWNRLIKEEAASPQDEGPTEEIPMVDIIITTCRESTEMIMDTVEAACQINYPVEAYRVIVSDDGDEEELRRKVMELKSQKHRHLFYHAREKPAMLERNPKARNINAALRWMSEQTIPKNRSEWFAVLDCDMIPEPEFLQVLVGHATKDAHIGMVATPQHYYNIPINDPLNQSMNIIYQVDEPVRAKFDGTWCTGTGFLARRAAIDSIGGMPETSLSEDILCGLLLNGQGWRVVYVNRPLQWGLLPDSIDGHIAQRRRWAVGTVQIAKILKFCCSSKVARMSFMQRLAGFSFCSIFSARNLTQPVGLFLLPWAFVSRHGVIDHEGLRRFLLWNFIGKIIGLCKTRVQMLWGSPHALLQREYGTCWVRNIYWVSIVVEVLPERLWHIRQWLSVPTFVSSGTIKSVLSERDPKARAPIGQRLRAVLFGRKYLPNTIMLVNAIVAFVVLLWTDIGRYRTTGAPARLVLVTSSLSPVLAWEYQASFLIPILYACFPPDMPERRELMQVDSQGTWRVRDEYKRERINQWAVLGELQSGFGLFWSGIALLLISTRLPGM